MNIDIYKNEFTQIQGNQELNTNSLYEIGLTVLNNALTISESKLNAIIVSQNKQIEQLQSEYELQIKSLKENNKTQKTKKVKQPKYTKTIEKNVVELITVYRKTINEIIEIIETKTTEKHNTNPNIVITKLSYRDIAKIKLDNNIEGYKIVSK